VELSDYASSVVPQGGLVDDMATISDVAALAGVGIGTVSRVLNGSHQVRPSTRAKVHAAMEQLDYRPTRSSAGSGAKRQGFVGVLVPFFDEPSSYQRLRGIVQSLQPHGLEIVLYNVDAPDRARRRLVEVPQHQLDGLIIIALPLRSEEGDRLAQAQFPTVLIDTSHHMLPSVLIDDRRGGRIATEHLMSLGHERIAFIGEPERNPFGFVSSRYRQEGYTAALADAGIAFDPRYVKHGPHVRTAARQLASELFAMADPPTAVVAASDVQALGVLEAARLAGKSVPRDVSIIGYDDIDLAAYSGLTTVRQPLEVSGQRGSEILTGALATGIRPIPFVEELAIELVVRGTTSAPPRASKVSQKRRDGTPMVICAFRPPVRTNTIDGAPAWWETAVVYQLYVRSFADSNDDGIGDLAGIRSRLSYLADLGIDAIWLNPCYPSPQADHGYDVADYFDIEPDYGDLDEFDALVRDARAVGIRIMMDVVPNHCSSNHAWFQAALAAPRGSSERERFYFRDGRGPGGEEPPNNWQAIFGGSAWTRVDEPDGSPGQWYLAIFTSAQPDLNWNHPDVVDHFDRMLRFWFDRGVEGFRADAVTVVGKTPGLPDNELQQGAARPELGASNAHFTWRPEGHAAWRHWRQLVEAYEEDHPGRQLVLVAEAYTPRRPDILRQYANDEEFHQAFAFDLMLAPWNAEAFRGAVRSTVEAMMPAGLLPAWTLNNHDAQRAVTRFGRADAETHGAEIDGVLENSHATVDVEVGTRRARAAALFELGLPGCVYLYSGEELGLPEVLDLPDEARQDPIFAKTGGVEIGRDGCRVPLPWTDDPATSFGFSPRGKNDPWLPQPKEWARWNVTAQQLDPNSMLALYRRALAIRRATPDLTLAGFELLLPDDPDLVVYRRGDVVVVLNMSDHERSLPADLVAGLRVLVSSVVEPAAAGRRGRNGNDQPAADAVGPDTAVWLGR
jgi:alpha-glucosidase